MARSYNMQTQEVTATGQAMRYEKTFMFMFTNLGDVPARVNGMLINPSSTPATVLGDSRTVGANQDEEFKGNIKVVFDATSAGVNPLVELVQLFYVD